MFLSLLAKECRQTMKSMIYWLIVVILVVFYFSQLGGMTIDEKPEPGQENYGWTYGGNETDIMESVLGRLVSEYLAGTYTTYPIGFYKSVTPSEEEQKRIGEIVEETTGLSGEGDIADAIQEAEGGAQVIYGSSPTQVKKGLTYERFKAFMQEVDDILGGGSYYAPDSLETSVSQPKSYEEALEDYNSLIENDHLTGGYARLFCDYMGILLGILPVFLAVTRGLRDRRSKMQELIASRKASSACIITSRYAAMLIMIMVPVLLLSCIPLVQCLQSASGTGIQTDVLAFVKYSFGWLLPTVMASAGVGLVLTELTDTALGVLVQIAWWFLTIFGSMNSMHGGAYGWSLVPRHNTVYNYSGFHENFGQLAANRGLYTAFSLLLLAISIFIYTQKRKGRLDIRGKIFGNLKRKHKA